MAAPVPCADPAPVVLDAFGLAGRAGVALGDGPEPVVQFGDIVLKSVADRATARWVQGLMHRCRPRGVRIARPRQSHDGRWEVAGWVANEMVWDLTPLVHDPERVVWAGDRLADAWHRAPSAVPMPIRTDRWARADRMAWGEEHVDLDAPARVVADRLARRTGSHDHRPEADEVVHGDLTGNVHVDAAGTPVVLDITPYRRPRSYAAAVVVADHLLWHDAGPTLRHRIGVSDDDLARALVFRLVAEQPAPAPRHGADLDDYERVIGLLDW